MKILDLYKIKCLVNNPDFILDTGLISFIPAFRSFVSNFYFGMPCTGLLQMFDLMQLLG